MSVFLSSISEMSSNNWNVWNNHKPLVSQVTPVNLGQHHAFLNTMMIYHIAQNVLSDLVSKLGDTMIFPNELNSENSDGFKKKVTFNL